VVSDLAFTGPLQLLYVGFSRLSNRKQLWRYLSKLFDENSSTQWCCNLYHTINVRHDLKKIISEVTMFLILGRQKMQLVTHISGPL
jgi:hypothetical protein